MTRADQDRAAVRRVGLVPIPFNDQRACLGRLADGQCDGCALLSAPIDGSQFPRVNLIVPELMVRGAGKDVRLVCRNRRTSGTHSPAASVGVDAGSVGAHADTVRPRTDQGKPLWLGGGVATSSAGAGLAFCGSEVGVA